ncbi:MAG: LysR family transcriptional regulator [Burkholderiales bacterium]
MNFPRTSLDQWRVLHAVVEHGGYAQAAAALHRSQSSVSYAVGRLQEQLGIALLEPAGRRMRITGAGQALMRDAVPLIDSLLKLESRAQSLQQGWEAEVRLAADSVYPVDALLCGLADFSAQCPGTRVQLHEVVMSGADDALISGQVDIAITHRVPQGFLGDWLLEVEFVAVAAPSHPLHALGRPATPDDLAQHLLVVMRDSGNRQPRDEGWLGASQRWTVSSPDTSISVVAAGLGFAWLPRHRIADKLATGSLKPLYLAAGQVQRAALHLVFANPEGAGPAARTMAENLRASARNWTQR